MTLTALAVRRIPTSLKRLRSLWVAGLVLVLAVAGVAMLGAARRTSATFDEVFMIASGARGWEIGRFDMTLDHPPVTQFLYGLPVYLTAPAYPDERAQNWVLNRFGYGRELLWNAGNDPERLTLLARGMGILLALGLVVAVATYTWRRYGPAAGFLAGTLIAFTPDVLAHGAIAYNDVPMALAYFLGVWSVDHAARGPTLRRMIAAAAVCTIAIGVKFSAVALVPVALILFGIELALHRGSHLRYVRRVALLTVPAVAAAYLILVAIYLGDFTLQHFRYGLEFNVRHASLGHGGVAAWLLGRGDPEGFWYFFPVAFLFKTPAAFHLLLIIALLGLSRGEGHADDAAPSSFRGPRVREALVSPLRAPVVGMLVFLAFLLRANLNIGFRHALPALPFVCVIVAVGAMRFWRTRAGPLRWTVPGLVALAAASSLSFYPHFIGYTSEYAPSRDRGYNIFVDSSLDWGQGLIELRDYMREQGIERVYLAYFGSALPEGYGIDYEPLPSFFRLPEREPTRPPPQHVVISATHLRGGYLPTDLYAEFRQREPDAVLAHSLFVFRVRD